MEDHGSESIAHVRITFQSILDLCGHDSRLVEEYLLVFLQYTCVSRKCGEVGRGDLTDDEMLEAKKETIDLLKRFTTVCESNWTFKTDA